MERVLIIAFYETTRFPLQIPNNTESGGCRNIFITFKCLKSDASRRHVERLFHAELINIMIEFRSLHLSQYHAKPEIRQHKI